MKKISQHTKLDEAYVEKDLNTYDNKPRQKVLPFEEDDLQEEIENKDRSDFYNSFKPKEPLNIKFPDVLPEHIKYNKLPEEKLNKLISEDEENYRRHLNNWYSKDQPFKPHYQEYYDLNEKIPEDIKKEIIECYNKLRETASLFQIAYYEANQLAMGTPELSYEGTYNDLFKSFGRFIVVALTKGVGELFGVVSNKSGDNRTANQLSSYLKNGINIFNITPLNFNGKIHEMESIINLMQSILTEYNKRKKILKKLPIEVNDGIKRFLMKKDTRSFLKWLDEYFSNDKKDFFDGMCADVLKSYTYSDSISIGSLVKIKTFSEIYYKSRKKATLDTFFSLEDKARNEIEDRLEEQLERLITPKLKEFDAFIRSTFPTLGERASYSAEQYNKELPERIKSLSKYIYVNYKLDIGSVLQFTEKYFYSPDKYLDFLGNFKEDLYSAVSSKYSLDINDFTRGILRSYTDKGKFNYEEFSKLTEKDLKEYANKFILEKIVNSMPNFRDRRGGYGRDFAHASFSGVGSIIKETGKFSIDSTVGFMHSKVPFVPKEFLLDLVRTVFRGQYKQTDKDENTIAMAPNEAFFEMSSIASPSDKTALKVILDILKRSGKFNPNSFTNLYLKYAKEINKNVGYLKTQIKNLEDEDYVKIYSLAIRSQDTVEQDKENLRKIIDYVHNAAGNIPGKDFIKILENKNYIQYSKSGISKKLLNAVMQIRNIGGIVGLKKKYGPVLAEMKENGLISKNFERNINFVLKTFNSGELIIPNGELFTKLFQATSEIETDMSAMEMGEAFKELIAGYQKKDTRLFNLDMSVSPTLRFRVLKDKDPRALRVGIETNCCQRIGGVGEVAARDSFINPLAGVLILEWQNKGAWELLGQSYFHYVPKNNMFILDNIETNSRNVQESEIDLSAAYAYLAQQVKQKYDVGYFLAGKSYSKVSTRDFKTNKLKGSDPRFFDPKAFTKDNRRPYSDFSTSDNMNLLKPNFDLDKRINKLTGKNKDIKEAFENILTRLIKTAMV